MLMVPHAHGTSCSWYLMLMVPHAHGTLLVMVPNWIDMNSFECVHKYALHVQIKLLTHPLVYSLQQNLTLCDVNFAVQEHV